MILLAFVLAFVLACPFGGNTLIDNANASNLINCFPSLPAKSKCSKINCCFGAVDIIRDIDSEVIEDKYRIDHPQQNNNIPSLNVV